MIRLNSLFHRLASCVVVVLALGRCTPASVDRQPVQVSASGPARIVTLGPAATEIVFRLGAGARLVGRSRWDRVPDEVQSIPDVGDAIRPSVERIVATRPDLVVLYPAGDNAAAMAALRAAGIPVLALRIDRIAEFLHAVDTLGTILDERARADSIVGAMTQALSDARAMPRGGPVRTVFIPVWHDPLMTVGAGSFLSELVEIAGGRNLYVDRSEPSVTVSFEDVIRRDPDVILVSPASVARLTSGSRWGALRAVRDGRVIMIDTTLMSQPSTRLGVAALVLAEALRAKRE